MNIVLDAFGGDNAPLEILRGAEMAVKELGVDILLSGDAEAIGKCAGENGISLQHMDIVHAPDILTMHDEPGEVIKSKSNSSLAVGLRDPRTGHRPWAVVQLRRENAAGSMYNLVGFQTNLKFSEQKRVFSMIPGLRDAEFVRYGVMHRNSFIDSPRLLQPDFSLRARPDIFIAGQLAGVEGYMESAAAGILAGINAVRRLQRKDAFIPPDYTMTGALARYISDETVKDFQPMGANFGVLPPLPERIRDKKVRYAALSARSLAWFDGEGMTGGEAAQTISE